MSWVVMGAWYRVLVRPPGLAAAPRRARGLALERGVSVPQGAGVDMPGVARGEPGAGLLAAAHLRPAAAGEAGEAHAGGVAHDGVDAGPAFPQENRASARLVSS